MADKKQNNTTSKFRFLGPLLGVGVLLLIMMFQAGAFATNQIEPGLNPEADEKADSYETLKVETQKVADYYTAIGTVRSRDEIEIIPRISARILEIKVRSGDRVEKGQILVKLDAKDLSAVVSQGQQRLAAASAQISSAEEQVNSAKASLELAKSELDRVRALFQKNAAARREYDQAMAAYRQAEAGLQQSIQQKKAASSNYAAAQQQIKQAEAGLGYATISSPIEGVVAERMADPGDMGNPASMIMRVFDPTSLMLEVPVRASLVLEITIGSAVDYDVPAIGKEYKGTVREIVPAVNPQTRTFLVKICIENSKGLMPGMFGTLTVPLKSDRNITLIPQTAISRTGQLESVFETVDGKILRHQIRTIPASGGLREVVSGLRHGQTIIKNVNKINL